MDDLDVTVPPRGVNLIAFAGRFQTICWSRPSSPATGGRRGGMLVSTSIPFATAAGWTVMIAAWPTVPSSTGRGSKVSLPDMIRETSSTSSMS